MGREKKEIKYFFNSPNRKSRIANTKFKDKNKEMKYFLLIHQIANRRSQTPNSEAKRKKENIFFNSLNCKSQIANTKFIFRQKERNKIFFLIHQIANRRSKTPNSETKRKK